MKSIIDNARGLHTEQGSGFLIQNDITGEGSGVEYVVHGSELTVANAGDYDDVISLPKGALITDIGVRFISPVKTANSDNAETLNLKVGFSAGGVDVINDLAILARNEEAVAGRAVSVSAGNTLQSGGTALSFVAGDTCLLHSDSARSLNTRLIVMTNNLATPGVAQVYVKYIVIK